MRITDINNNANSVRVYDHRTHYTKAGLLAYARNVNEAKYADIGWNKSTLTHEIDGGAMRIKHKKPTRKEHTLFINQHEPFDYGYQLEDDEYLHNIIAMGNDSNGEFNRSEYGKLYDRIIDNIILGDMPYDIVGFKGLGYKTATEYINDALWVNANTYQVGKLKKVLEKYRTSLDTIGRKTYYDEDVVADVMTIFTPHKWETTCITGVVQSEWTDIIYPADMYDKEDIETFEALYFGLFMEYEAEYKGESIWYTFCNFHGKDNIIKWISEDYGTSNVKYYEC